MHDKARDSYVLATVTLFSRGLPVVSTTRIIDRVGQFYTGVGHSMARECDVRARVEVKGRATFAYRIVSFDPGEDLPEVISRVVR